MGFKCKSPSGTKIAEQKIAEQKLWNKNTQIGKKTHVISVISCNLVTSVGNIHNVVTNCNFI